MLAMIIWLQEINVNAGVSINHLVGISNARKNSSFQAYLIKKNSHFYENRDLGGLG